MITSAYSNRIYKKDLNNEQLTELSNLMINFSNTKIKCYSDKIKNKINNFNTTYIKNTFKYNTYYSNMIIKEVNQCISSNTELQKLYISDIEEKIKQKKEKLEKLNNTLLYWRDLKSYCIKLTKNKTEELKFIFPFYFYEEDNKIYVKNSKNKNFSLYDFETQVVTKQIGRRKHNIYQLKLSIKQSERKLEKIKNKPYISCFGTKDFFKKQFTVDKYKNDHKLWKEAFFYRRHKNITISGCSTWKQGNGCIRYKNNTLSIMKMNDNIIENRKTSKSEWFDIPVTFKYNEEFYYKALVESKSSVAYQIKDFKNYFIIQAIFEVEKDKRTNFSLADGVVSIDINYNHFALTNIDKHGNYLNSKIIDFDIKGKTSNQITKIIEEKVLEVIKYCELYHKPLIRENIQKIVFKNLRNKKGNKRISQFAYNKMITTIDRCGFKHNIEVYKIEPAYTSQLGKIKYMKQLGLSIHQSASFCIGRRFLLTKKKKRKFKNYPKGRTKEIREKMKLKSQVDKENKKLNIKKKKELRKLEKKKTIPRRNYYIEKLNKYKQFGDYKKICFELKSLWKPWYYELDNIGIKLKDYEKLKQYVTAVKEYFKTKNDEKVIKNITTNK